MTEQEKRDIDAALERMGDFLETEIEPMALARRLREASYMLTQLAVRDKEGLYTCHVEDANFYLHFLAEQLDPYFDDLF